MAFSNPAMLPGYGQPGMGAPSMPPGANPSMFGPGFNPYGTGVPQTGDTMGKGDSSPLFRSSWNNANNIAMGMGGQGWNLGMNDYLNGQNAYGQFMNNLGRAYNPDVSTGAVGGFFGGMGDYGKSLDAYDKAISDFTPGYTDAEKQGMKTAVGGGIIGAQAAAAEKAKNLAATSGNAAGLRSQIAMGGHQAGRDLAEGMGGLQGQFGQARQQGQQFKIGAQQQGVNARQFVPGQFNNFMQNYNQTLPLFLQGANYGQQGYQIGTNTGQNALNTLSGGVGQMLNKSTSNAPKGGAANTAGIISSFL